MRSKPHSLGIQKKIREIDKIGYTRVVSEQNRVPFFPRRGALTYACKTPPNRLLAPELTAPCVRADPKPFFRRSNPQNGANDGPQKVLSTDNPILFRNTPGIPRPVLRFHQLPDFGHTAPVFVHLQNPRRHGNGRHPPATQLWKIPHTTSNLATVMRPQQHC